MAPRSAVEGRRGAWRQKVGGRGGAQRRGGRLRLAAMQRTWSSYLARPATSDRGAADLKALPLPPAPCLLAAWFLDVCFQVMFFLISLLKCVTFYTHNCHFGNGYGYFWCPKPVIWQAWCLQFGTLGDHGAIQGHLGGHQMTPWGPDLDFLILDGFWDPILIAFRAPWAKIVVLFSCLFPGHFF